MSAVPPIIPRLIHPQTVILEKPDRDSTVWDEDYREEHGELQYGSRYSLKAQVSYKKFRYKEATKDGAMFAGDGYLFFNRNALAEEGFAVAIDDHIVSISGLSVDYYIIDIVPAGHYNVPYFLMAIFERRKEGRGEGRGGGLR